MRAHSALPVAAAWALVWGALVYARFVQRFSADRFPGMQFGGAAAAGLAAAFIPTRLGPIPLLCVLLVLQVCYFGGARFFPQIVVHGRLNWEFCERPLPPGVEFFVLVGNDTRRRANVAAQLARRPDWNASLVSSVAPPPGFANTAMGHTVSYMAILGWASQKWAVVLEDDFVPFWGFDYLLPCALDDDMDLVWLDARSHFMAVFDGCHLANTVGLAVRVAAIPVILARAAPGAEYQLQHERAHPAARFAIDSLMGQMCCDGLLRCRARPLASEVGLPSTNVDFWAPPPLRSRSGR
jgi:hypothetical protein